MANQFNSASNEKQMLSSTQPMFPPNPNFSAETNPSAPPPSYPGSTQFPAPSGMVCLQYYPPPTPGYPQSWVPPPYYQQGGAGVVYPEPPPDTKYPAEQPKLHPQQQQQQVVVTSQMPGGVTPVVIDNGPPVSMIGAFVMSFVVCFVGGLVCGVMAFALAIIGRNSAASGNRRGAVQMRNASFGFSIFGIVASIAVVAIYLGVFLSPAFTTDRIWPLSMFTPYNSTYYSSGLY